MDPASASHIYVVRVWRASAEPSGFRASVRAVENEEAHLFTSGEAVGQFLAAQCARRSGGAAPEAGMEADDAQR